MAAASKGCQGLQKRRIGKGGEKVKEKKLQWERRLGGGGGGGESMRNNRRPNCEYRSFFKSFSNFSLSIPGQKFLVSFSDTPSRKLHI